MNEPITMKLSHALIAFGVFALIVVLVVLALFAGESAKYTALRLKFEQQEKQITALEAWRNLVPDGTGIDRWRGSTMKHYMTDWKRRNPDHDVPDVDDFRHR